MGDSLRLFALEGTRDLGGQIGEALGLPLAEHEERDFEDGEHKVRPMEDIAGKDVFVIHSLYSDPKQTVNDKLCRLLFFVGALRSASARRVVPVVPYLCYARKDRKTKPRDPITTQYIARIFEAMQIDLFVGLDVHNLPAFQNAFRCPTHHLEARKIFVERLVPSLADDEPVVLSPDSGGVKRAEKFREALAAAMGRDVDSAFIEKHRSEGVVSGETLVGDVAGKTVLVVDDLISSGTTMIRAAAACDAAGARRVIAVATHGLFTGDAADVLADKKLAHVWVTDTVSPFRLNPGLLGEKVTVVPSAPLLAGAIKRIHESNTLASEALG